MNIFSKLTLASAIAALAVTATARAQTDNPFKFHVDINTSSLKWAPSGPFFLDFQLNKGDSWANNSVFLSDFAFDLGGASGPAQSFGLTSGDLDAGIWLNESDASPFNEIFQGFTSGTLGIHFNATVTQNPFAVQPDGFVVSILTSEIGNPQIYTTAPDGVSLLSLALSGSNTLSDVQTFAGISPNDVKVNAAPVPEPSTYGFMAGGLLLGFIALRRRLPRKA